MPSYNMTGYKWAGFTDYDSSVRMTVTDDDDQMDWYGQDTGESERVEIDGDTFDIRMTGTIKTKFVDSDGNKHTEDFVFTSTGDGYYFVPPPGSAFDEGSSITRFANNRWSDTDGVDYDEVVCFTPGARILTDKGWTAAGLLRPGDRVQTVDNGFQPVKWAGRSDIPNGRQRAQGLNPICIKKDCFGPGLPARDLFVSPQHRFCMTGTETLFGEAEMLAPAKALVDGHRVTTSHTMATLAYCHILLENHEILFSEGIWTESFQPSMRTLQILTDQAKADLSKVMSQSDWHMPAARSSLRPWEARLLTTSQFSLCA